MDLTPLRLDPTMSSLKLLAYRFIKRFLEEYGMAPSQSEIAAALRVDKKRANDLVRQLALEQMIVHARGRHRGISLPGIHEQAIRQLEAIGYRVNLTTREVAQPETIPGLPARAALDHTRDVEIGVMGNGRNRRRCRGADAARTDRAGESRRQG